MRFILYAFVLGFLFVWALENIPDFVGYVFVGIILILALRLLKKGDN